jgi:hypothetical protein
MTSILNRSARLLVVPEPLSFSCPTLDFDTLAEAATYAVERLSTAYLVWAHTRGKKPIARKTRENSSSFGEAASIQIVTGPPIQAAFVALDQIKMASRLRTPWAPTQHRLCCGRAYPITAPMLGINFKDGDANYIAPRRVAETSLRLSVKLGG